MKKKDLSIKKMVLLGPCDIQAECKKFLSEEEYKTAKEEATRLVNEKKETELIDFSVLPNKKISAGTYYQEVKRILFGIEMVQREKVKF